MDTITTSDLSAFGNRERHMLSELLTAWEEQGLPGDFECYDVIPMMNTNSGNVFLTNSDLQVAMMNGDSLESFYTCPYCGHEGFKEEMEHDEQSDDEDCKNYLDSIGITFEA